MDPERCQRIMLGGLNWSECTALAVSVGVTLTPRAARRLADHTAGLPIYVRRLLTDVDPSAFDTAADHLPVPRSLASTILGRLAMVSPDAQALAAALAVLAAPATVRQLAAMAHPANAEGAVDELVGSSLVQRSAGRARPGRAHPPAVPDGPL